MIDALLDRAEALLDQQPRGITLEKARVFAALIEQTSRIIRERNSPLLLRRTVQEIDSPSAFQAGDVGFLPCEDAQAVFLTDLHGDYASLARIMLQQSRAKYWVFGGDFVDGGRWSLDVAMKALCVYLRQPGQVFLLGGNVDRDPGLVIEPGIEWFRLQLADALGEANGLALYEQWRQLVRRDMAGIAVTKNQFALVHANPPSLKTPGYDPAAGLLGLMDNPLAKHSMAADSLRRPTSASLNDGSAAENAKYTAEKRAARGADYPPTYINGVQSVMAFLEGTGTRYFIRGHDSGAPADKTLINGTGITVHGSGGGSPQAIHPNTLARYAVIQLDKEYSTFDPTIRSGADQIVHLVWQDR